MIDRNPKSSNSSFFLHNFFQPIFVQTLDEDFLKKVHIEKVLGSLYLQTKNYAPEPMRMFVLAEGVTLNQSIIQSHLRNEWGFYCTKSSHQTLAALLRNIDSPTLIIILGHTGEGHQQLSFKQRLAGLSDFDRVFEFVKSLSEGYDDLEKKRTTAAIDAELADVVMQDHSGLFRIVKTTRSQDKRLAKYWRTTVSSKNFGDLYLKRDFWLPMAWGFTNIFVGPQPKDNSSQLSLHSFALELERSRGETTASFVRQQLTQRLAADFAFSYQDLDAVYISAPRMEDTVVLFHEFKSRLTNDEKSPHIVLWDLYRGWFPEMALVKMMQSPLRKCLFLQMTHPEAFDCMLVEKTL
jgi:hypothetical protein